MPSEYRSDHHHLFEEVGRKEGLPTSASISGTEVKQLIASHTEKGERKKGDTNERADLTQFLTWSSL